MRNVSPHKQGACLALAIFLAFVGRNAAAIEGTAANYSQPMDSVCRILFYDPQGKFKTMCSGVLTSAKEIRTATHCFTETKDTTMEVSCGFSGVDSAHPYTEKTADGKLAHTKDVKFKERHLKVAQVLADGGSNGGRSDSAVIILQEPSSLESVPILDQKSARQIVSNHQFRHCKVAGFGVSNDQTGGVLGSADLDSAGKMESSDPLQVGYRLWLHPNEKTSADLSAAMAGSPSQIERVMAQARVLTNSKLLKTLAIYGDSGGPLFCQLPSTGGWFVVGTFSGLFIDFFTKEEARAIGRKDGALVTVTNAWDFPVTQNLVRVEKLQHEPVSKPTDHARALAPDEAASAFVDPK